MAYVRKLPSGRWQATVRLPSGKKTTRTDRLQRVVVDWARAEEDRIARGHWRDPRASRMTVGERWELWRPSRQLARKTLEMYDTRWKHQIKPHFGDWPMIAITRTDVEAWSSKMIADGVTTRANQQAIVVLSAMLSAAENDQLIPANPARKANGPKSALKPPDWFTRKQHAAIVKTLADDSKTGALIDFDMHVGLRWGELAALRVGRVDFTRGTVFVVDVLDGHEIRQYPKSKKSFREVPVPPPILAALKDLCAGRSDDDFVFTSPEGGILRHPNWIRRVWQPTLKAAGVPYKTPHVMRHTAASWLVQQGVDLYRVQALLGHESFATTQRYAHLAPEAHDVVLQAWADLK
jgi:integrase